MVTETRNNRHYRVSSCLTCGNTKKDYWVRILSDALKRMLYNHKILERKAVQAEEKINLALSTHSPFFFAR